MELAAVRREQHAEALAFDIAGEQLANFRIVVDDENALRGGGHRPWGEDGLRSFLTSPRHGHERIFVTKTSGLAGGKRFDQISAATSDTPRLAGKLRSLSMSAQKQSDAPRAPKFVPFLVVAVLGTPVSLPTTGLGEP